MAELIDKVPPPQRCSPADLEALTDRLFLSRDLELPLYSGPIAVSLLLDILTDLRDLRNCLLAPGDSPEERVDWYLAQIHAEFMEARKQRRCRICGCTDDDCSGCIERTGERCSWVEANLCSACHG